MRIKPFSSFTDASVAADFPALKLLFHKDDCTAAGVINQVVTWIDRVSGVTLTITPDVASTISKDAEGVYSDSFVTCTTAGTMPTVTTAHYALIIGIGAALDSSSVGGAGFTVGGDVANKLSMGTTGAIKYNSAALNTQPALSPTALTTLGRKVCAMSYADFADVAGSPVNPRIDRVTSNDDYASAVSTTFSSGSTTTTAGAVITPGQFADAFAFASMGSGTGARQRVMALFLFTTPITFNELKLAAIEMARTGELYAGWRNKA